MAFSVKSANFENHYFSAKSKAIGFAFSVKSANFENPYFSAKSKVNACGSCNVRPAHLKRGGMNNEALGGRNWVVSANFILLQANEESQFLLIKFVCYN